MGNFSKILFAAVDAVVAHPSDLAKFFQPTVSPGLTVFPKTTAEQLRLGVRWDYAGVITREGTQYHEYKLQPNAGKIPSTIEQWRDKNGGTHATITTLAIPINTMHDEDVFRATIAEALNGL